MSIANLMLSMPLPVLNYWGYWIILLAATLEAMPFAGLFVPGMVIVILGGFLAKLGILGMGEVIFVAVVGSILGDLIGYLIGKKYGYSFITRYGKYFFFKKEHLEKVRKLMNKHTGKALIMGRFNSLTRSLAPFVAGTTNVRFLKFMIYNLIGGISWAISFVLVGFIFGESYEVASKYIGKFIFIGFAVGILLIYIYRFINKRKRIFSRYHLYALILNISSLYLFSKIMEDVVDGELITKLDIWTNAKMVLLWSPVLNKLMIFITGIANPKGLIILSVILLGVLIYKKKWYHSLLLFSSMIGGLLFELLIKSITHRARPENALIEVTGYSFPSGHATMAIIFFSLLLYSFKEDIKNEVLRNLFIIGSVAIFLLIGFSRVYLNVHWLSDVIAGFSLGIFWLTLLILIFKTTASLSKKTRALTSRFFGKN